MLILLCTWASIYISYGATSRCFWATGDRRRRLTFSLSQVTISCKHQDNKTWAMGKMSEMNAPGAAPAAAREGPGRKDTRGMRLLRWLSFASRPWRYCPPALSAGEVYVEGFLPGRGGGGELSPKAPRNLSKEGQKREEEEEEGRQRVGTSRTPD